MNNDLENGERILRNQTLIVVEGDHERSVVLRMFFRCFPDMNIPYDNVHVFGTKIYVLYDEIEGLYGDGIWETDDEDIDIPLLISKREKIVPALDKRNFSNIFLIFDYERQDSKFSVEKISRLQRHFCSPTDDGILFINYPMIEAYKDMAVIPDDDYYTKKYEAIKQPGSFYKCQVREMSFLEKYIDVYDRVLKFCNKISDDGNQAAVADKILSLTIDSNLEKELLHLAGLSNDTKKNAKYYLGNLLKENVSAGSTYWSELRRLLIIIAAQNIGKAYMLQQGCDVAIPVNNDMYYELDYTRILSIQNHCSCELTSKYVWVLSTCMCILGEYKFFWKTANTLMARGGNSSSGH